MSPSQVLTTVENSFTKGLITEFTGLNFPENAATDSDNTEYTIIGDVIRREGIDIETNGVAQALSRTNLAISTYKWNNAGGDGSTQIVVKQVGGTLYFYQSSNATVAAPLSTTKLASTVDVSTFVAAGGTFDATQECQYADGNGYLIVYHPTCDPFYCTFSAGTITGTVIIIQIRDLTGIPETGVADNFRPLTLSNEHKYNLINQGWIAGSPWSSTSTTSQSFSTGAKTFTIATGITGITAGQGITINDTTLYGPGGIFGNSGNYLVGTVTSYTSGTGALIVSITSFSFAAFGPGGGASNNPNNSWSISVYNSGYLTTWNTAIGNYPSNADQWWSFKNSSNVFDPATTQANTSIGSGPAPKGSVLLKVFQQQRSSQSGVPSLTDITTTVRPRTGCWYQGRVWYTGVDAQAAAAGDEPFTTWTESIYFSQIITNVAQFGRCYQANDLTSELLFGLLPTDGGVINIPGAGPIYKLFPLQNALIIFAANGVWYLTGSQGIGFAANDYTIVKLSSVRSISSTSFVDVQGLPMFWNEEGIYSVQGAKQGTSLLNNPLHVNPLEVIPITLGTILSFYSSIPFSSKKYARGVYDPIEYVVKWLYRDTEAADVTGRYTYNKILNFNDSNKAFFPFTIDTTKASINSIIYVVGPGGSTSPSPIVKYVASTGSNIYFADERDTTYVDWASQTGGVNFTSTFTTGYKLHGQGQRRFQIPYVYLYNRTTSPVSYKIQSLWDYASDRNSNRWSIPQITNINNTHFNMTSRRHKLRGQGLVLQIKISSVDGQPFDIIGWSTLETQNTGA